MNKKATGAELIKHLDFEVEATPQEDASAVNIKDSGNMTSLNVKVRVRKKPNGSIQDGTIAIERFDLPENPVERIRLASSDQTLMAFNMMMEAGVKKKVAKKPTLLGICLGVQQDEDNDSDQYTPTTNTSLEQEKSVNKPRKARPIPKHVEENTGSLKRSKKDKIFGKCKPGGCLDPPFGEDKYAYQPNAQTLTEIRDTNERKAQDTTDAVSKSSNSNAVDTEILGDVDVNTEDREQTIPLDNNLSDDIITTYSSSETKNKNKMMNTSSVKQSKTSFNEFRATYFSLPRTSNRRKSNGNTSVIKEEVLTPKHMKSFVRTGRRDDSDKIDKNTALRSEPKAFTKKDENESDDCNLPRSRSSSKINNNNTELLVTGQALSLKQTKTMARTGRQQFDDDDTFAKNTASRSGPETFSQNHENESNQPENLSPTKTPRSSKIDKRKELMTEEALVPTKQTRSAAQSGRQQDDDDIYDKNTALRTGAEQFHQDIGNVSENFPTKLPSNSKIKNREKLVLTEEILVAKQSQFSARSGRQPVDDDILDRNVALRSGPEAFGQDLKSLSDVSENIIPAKSQGSSKHSQVANDREKLVMTEKTFASTQAQLAVRTGRQLVDDVTLVKNTPVAEKNYNGLENESDKYDSLIPTRTPRNNKINKEKLITGEETLAFKQTQSVAHSDQTFDDNGPGTEPFNQDFENESDASENFPSKFPSNSKINRENHLMIGETLVPKQIQSLARSGQQLVEDDTLDKNIVFRSEPDMFNQDLKSGTDVSENFIPAKSQRNSKHQQVPNDREKFDIKEEEEFALKQTQLAARAGSQVPEGDKLIKNSALTPAVKKKYKGLENESDKIDNSSLARDKLVIGDETLVPKQTQSLARSGQQLVNDDRLDKGIAFKSEPEELNQDFESVSDVSDNFVPAKSQRNSKHQQVPNDREKFDIREEEFALKQTQLAARAGRQAAEGEKFIKNSALTPAAKTNYKGLENESDEIDNSISARDKLVIEVETLVPKQTQSLARSSPQLVEDDTIDKNIVFRLEPELFNEDFESASDASDHFIPAKSQRNSKHQQVPNHREKFNKREEEFALKQTQLAARTGRQITNDDKLVKNTVLIPVAEKKYKGLENESEEIDNFSSAGEKLVIEDETLVPKQTQSLTRSGHQLVDESSSSVSTLDKHIALRSEPEALSKNFESLSDVSDNCIPAKSRRNSKHQQVSKDIEKLVMREKTLHRKQPKSAANTHRRLINDDDTMDKNNALRSEAEPLNQNFENDFDESESISPTRMQRNSKTNNRDEFHMVKKSWTSNQNLLVTQSGHQQIVYDTLDKNTTSNSGYEIVIQNPENDYEQFEKFEAGIAVSSRKDPSPEETQKYISEYKNMNSNAFVNVHSEHEKGEASSKRANPIESLSMRKRLDDQVGNNKLDRDVLRQDYNATEINNLQSVTMNSSSIRPAFDTIEASLTKLSDADRGTTDFNSRNANSDLNRNTEIEDIDTEFNQEISIKTTVKDEDVLLDSKTDNQLKFNNYGKQPKRDSMGSGESTSQKYVIKSDHLAEAPKKITRDFFENELYNSTWEKESPEFYNRRGGAKHGFSGTIKLNDTLENTGDKKSSELQDEPIRKKGRYDGDVAWGNTLTEKTSVQKVVNRGNKEDHISEFPSHSNMSIFTGSESDEIVYRKNLHTQEKYINSSKKDADPGFRNTDKLRNSRTVRSSDATFPFSQNRTSFDGYNNDIVKKFEEDVVRDVLPSKETNGRENGVNFTSIGNMGMGGNKRKITTNRILQLNKGSEKYIDYNTNTEGKSSYADTSASLPIVNEQNENQLKPAVIRKRIRNKKDLYREHDRNCNKEIANKFEYANATNLTNLDNNKKDSQRVLGENQSPVKKGKIKKILKTENTAFLRDGFPNQINKIDGSVEEMGNHSQTVVFDSGMPGNSGRVSSVNNASRGNDFHEALLTILNKQLVPLQSIIESLKEEMDFLTTQQMTIKARLDQSEGALTRQKPRGLNIRRSAHRYYRNCNCRCFKPYQSGTL